MSEREREREGGESERGGIERGRERTRIFVQPALGLVSHGLIEKLTRRVLKD